MADFTFANHGSVCILTPHTEDAFEWVDENINDDHQTWGPTGIVIEPRYVEPILQGIEQGGLSCEEG